MLTRNDVCPINSKYYNHTVKNRSAGFANKKLIIKKVPDIQVPNLALESTHQFLGNMSYLVINPLSKKKEKR